VLDERERRHFLRVNCRDSRLSEAERPGFRRSRERGEGLASTFDCFTPSHLRAEAGVQHETTPSRRRGPPLLSKTIVCGRHSASSRSMRSIKPGASPARHGGEAVDRVPGFAVRRPGGGVRMGLHTDGRVDAMTTWS